MPILNSNKFLAFLLVTLVYVETLFNPLPFFTIPVIIAAPIVFWYVNKKYIKQPISISDIIFTFTILLIYIVITFGVIIYIISHIDWWKIIIVGLVIDLILLLTGFLPVIGDIIGGLISAIILIKVFGVTAGMFLAAFVFLIALIPFHIPVVTLLFVFIKIIMSLI